MHSPKPEEPVNVSRTSLAGTSSMTLPEISNGWETSSSEGTANPSSQSSSTTQDELIGSPPRSVISDANTESSTTESDNNPDFDQDTVVSLNNRTLTEELKPDMTRSPEASLSACGGAAVGSVDDIDMNADFSDTDSAFSVDSRVESEKMKRVISKLKCDLESERDSVMQLRKKVTTTNKEKLMQNSRFNEEMSLLKYENVALQARVEEQSVHTEQLEYELTKVKKKHNQDNNFADQREAQDTKQIADLKTKREETESWLSEAERKLAALEEQHTTTKRETAEELHKLKIDIENKDSLTAKLKQETEISKTENCKLTDFIKEQESTLKEMLEKLESTEAELKAVSTDLDNAQRDLTEQKYNTEEQAQLLQELHEKCKTLTTSYDNEKCTSETQFSNLEAVEAKSVHLECALNDEKAVSGELRFTAETLRSDLSDLEDKYSKQCRDYSESQHTLTRAEQELDNHKRQLNYEKEDKRDLVNKLKRQLDIHQEHNGKLKTELAASHKQQKYLEEVSQKIVDDLQPVFEGFPCETGEITLLSPDKTAKASTERTRNVFDTLHNTVSRYKKRFTALADEKSKAKAQCDSLTKEAATYKEMLYKKEKELDDCQTRLTDATREVDRVSQDSSEVEARCATMTVDLEGARSHNDTLQAQCQSLKHEMLQMRGRYDKEIDEKQIYLQRIYHLLTSDLDMTLSDPSTEREKFTWNELSATVSEKISAILNEVHHLRQRIARLDDTLSKNESYIEELRAEHNDGVTEMNRQLSAAVEKNSSQWREERNRLEEHYNNIMNENVNRQQIYKEQLEKSKRDADDAWDRLKGTDEANRTLESEKFEFQERTILLERQQRALLCALALISGSYFPLLARSRQLQEQRAIFMQEAKRFSAFKTQISSLLGTLVAEDGTPMSTPRGSVLHRLRFRKLGIAVLAANRLLRLGRVRNSFSVRDGERQTNILCWMTADCAASDETTDVSEGHLIQWLSHVDLESVALNSTKELLDSLDKLRHDGASGHHKLKTTLTSTLSKLIRQLSVLYSAEDRSLRGMYHYSQSYIDLPARLAHGLHSSMVRLQPNDQLYIVPSQATVTSLQERVLSFVQQLHTSESERKRLRGNIDSLNQNLAQLTQYQQACGDMEDELHSVRKQMESLVPNGRVDQVMSELNQALDRERKTQTLLAEQGSQIKQLSRRIEIENTDREHSEQSVKFSVKQLQDELDNKSTAITNLTRQVATLESERRSLHDNIYDAETALNTAAQDRHTLSNYVETLTHTFNKCLSDSSQSDLSRVMLSGELIPSGRSGPELLAVQKLVHEFIECHSALQAKISALNTVTNEQLHDITRMKQEMSLVCTGMKNYPRDNSQMYSYPSSSGYSSLSPLKLPLADISSLNTPPASIDTGLMTRAMSYGQSDYRSPADIQSHHRTGSAHYPISSSPLRKGFSPSKSSSIRGAPSPRLQMSGNLRR